MLLSFGRLPYVNVQKFVSNKNLAHLLVLPLGLEGLLFLCVAWKNSGKHTYPHHEPTAFEANPYF